MKYFNEHSNTISSTIVCNSLQWVLLVIPVDIIFNRCNKKDLSRSIKICVLYRILKVTET